MAVRSIAQLKAWFKRGLYPTAAQFADLMDSYFHKTDDTIPISSVDELSDRLNAKYDLSDGEILEEKTDQIRRNLETHESEADYKFSQIDSEFESVKGEIDNLHSEDNAIRRDFDAGDAATLQAANEYTDSMGVSIREEIILEGGLALQAAKSYTNERVANIVNSAPETLDTLQELADALGNDPNFATTVSNTIGNKVDKVAGSALMSSADKAKLDGVAAGANAYSHPATHPASMIAEDALRRFITDAERQTWNSKPSGSNATPSANGLMAAGDKVKLDGVAVNANNYTHPADANTRHVTDAEKTAWNGKANGDHTHALATTGANGLMAAGDKSKLDGVATGANNYTHPSTHAISQVSGLQTALDGKVAATANNGMTARRQNSSSSSDETQVTPDGISIIRCRNNTCQIACGITGDGITLPSSAVINMPCVVLAGYGVSSAGTILYRYGAKIHSLANVTRPAGTFGVYVIPHNIGHTDYNLDISIQTADNDYFYVWKEIKSARTSTTTRIKIAQVGGGLSMVDFMATFTGKNY